MSIRYNFVCFVGICSPKLDVNVSHHEYIKKVSKIDIFKNKISENTKENPALRKGSKRNTAKSKCVRNVQLQKTLVPGLFQFSCLGSSTLFIEILFLRHPKASFHTNTKKQSET